MAEEIFYRDKQVEITTTLARFGAVTYPINGIGSVLIERPNRTGLVVLALGAFILAYLAHSARVYQPITAIVAILGCLFAIAAWRMPYRLVLRTASGDLQAMKSRELRLLADIKFAIEKAVVSRG